MYAYADAFGEVDQDSMGAIIIKDRNTKGIASISSGIRYTPTAGTVEEISLVSTDGQVEI